MPTGYTQKILDGEVKTAKDFLHLCLRNFGVLHFLRDRELTVQDDYTRDIIDNFDEDIKYHQKELDSARKRLKDYLEMSESKLKKIYIEMNQEKSESLGKTKDTYDKNNEVYRQFLKTIQDWDCDGEFTPVKNFAVDQIKISMKDDDWVDEELSKSLKSTEEMFQEEKDEFRKKLIEDAQWDINYHTEEMEKCEKRKSDFLDYYRRFKKELKKLK